MPAPHTVVVGVTGARQNAAVAVCVDGAVRGVCEQERVTRVRRAALAPGQLPIEALEAALGCAGGLTPGDVTTYVTAEPGVDLPAGVPVVRLDHHEAHAAAAFHLAPFDRAAVLICDRDEAGPISVWTGAPDRLVRESWPDPRPGFSSVFAAASRLFGFASGQEHELEGLARLDAGTDTGRLDDVLAYRDGVLWASPDWQTRLATWLGESSGRNLRHRARVAAAFQHHLGAQLLALVQDVLVRTGQRRLCLGGGLFYNTYFTTLLRQAGAFDDVFVAPNPGNAGISLGSALLVANGGARPATAVSPFLGPEYDVESIKRTLDNCKLSFDHLDEDDVIEEAARALGRGQLVGWFQGRMEWGHRALGNRSILASPLSPFVLENLNVYLKHRQHHRAYGVSVPVDQTARFFSGPSESPYMEYEYAPVDPVPFRPIMPDGTRTLRVQTIPTAPDAGSSDRFRRLHERFGGATGVPVLVNTSFNGFLEPMVCSPRDAIRLFYGSGLDLLVLDRFVMRK